MDDIFGVSVTNEDATRDPPHIGSKSIIDLAARAEIAVCNRREEIAIAAQWCMRARSNDEGAHTNYPAAPKRSPPVQAGSGGKFGLT